MYKTLLLLIIMLFSYGTAPVAAQGTAPIGACENVQIDFGCQREKLINPQADCQVTYCGDAPSTSTSIDFQVFNVRFQLSGSQGIAQLIYLAFMGFLGVVALAVTVLGVYAAFRRAQADSEEAVASANKTMRNAIVGLIIIGASLLIVQIVASVLGVGNIFEIATFE
jgi:hypothetical protein